MYVDLSIKVEKDNPIYANFADNANKLLQFGHLGTHIDTYLQTSIPLEYMDLEAILFDISLIADRDVELADFDHEKIKAYDFVLFKTDMTTKYQYGTKEYFQNQPQLSHAVIDFLIQRKVRFIGLDAGGARRGQEHIAVDKLCEENGIYVIENLTHLDVVANKNIERFEITTLWIELAGQTGLPCRVVATL